MLDAELTKEACNHSRRLTESWLRGYDVQPVLVWLDSQGGYCDCEVLANAEEIADDATKC